MRLHIKHNTIRRADVPGLKITTRRAYSRIGNANIVPDSNILSAHKYWLGRQDSNLGMSVPKTDALPLGDAPTCWRRAPFLRRPASRGAGEIALSRPACNGRWGKIRGPNPILDPKTCKGCRYCQFAGANLQEIPIAHPRVRRYRGAPARGPFSDHRAIWISECSSAW